jgi:DNA recombination protein RmuC
METILAFIGGVVLGALVATVAAYMHGRSAREAMERQFRDAFAGLSVQALASNSEQFLRLARENLAGQTTAGAAELDSRKQLIDKSIQQVTERLEAIRDVTGKLEAARKQDYGSLSQRLTETLGQVDRLRQTTEDLRAALAHPQRRGQWGERMADDILQAAGMIEGVNYTKQQTVAETGKRPDFTFNLPNSVKLNMDAKFPLDNYLKHIEADDPAEKAKAAQSFISDLRTQVRAIASREYIDPSTGTADFALMFIPNEQMFAFIQDLDLALLKEAAQRHVMLVGPLSLLAVLAIARQAAEAANLSRQADQALTLLGDFAKQWNKFKEEMDKLGVRLNSALEQFQSLSTTRANVLERPLLKLQQLREDQGQTNRIDN